MWIGDQEADVAQIALGYVLRFGQEHGYRFDKQCLLWEQPRLRTPEQFERWSHIVAIAHNHLVLARDLVEAELRPWESKHRQPTPQQVRRGMHKLLARLGTPARPPQPRGKSKGRKQRSKRKEGQAISRHSQNAEGASTCTIVMAVLAFQLSYFLFNGTSFDVLIEPLSLNVNSLLFLLIHGEHADIFTSITCPMTFCTSPFIIADTGK